jgi:hypothetical protein
MTESMNEALKLMIVLPFYLKFVKGRCLYSLVSNKGFWAMKLLLFATLNWLIDCEVCSELLFETPRIH